LSSASVTSHWSAVTHAFTAPAFCRADPVSGRVVELDMRVVEYEAYVAVHVPVQGEPDVSSLPPLTVLGWDAIVWPMMKLSTRLM
jgi:hypothetical protein